jgi:hypothetical protein
MQRTNAYSVLGSLCYFLLPTLQRFFALWQQVLCKRLGVLLTHYQVLTSLSGLQVWSTCSK